MAQSLADELLSYGPDVVVMAPDEVRAAVIRRLTARRAAEPHAMTAERAEPGRADARARALPARAATGSPSTRSPRDFGVQPAQIVKDLKVLWFCGLPNSVTGDMIDIDMEALDGEGVVKLSNADYLTRPLRLAPHEALALMVALRALREVSAPGERDVVDRALKKIEAASGDVERPRGGGRHPHRPGRHRRSGRPSTQALRDERRLRLTLLHARAATRRPSATSTRCG